MYAEVAAKKMKTGVCN